MIRQQVNGERYDLSSRTYSIRAALEQLKRFQADPEGYDPRGDVAPNAIYLDLELATQYLAYSLDECENTREWVTKQRTILAWWAERLRGVDLRAASVRDSILPALDEAAGKAHKVAVLKAIYTWLRRVRRVITLAEDPTAAGALTIPAPRKQHGVSPKAVPREHVELARQHLVGGWADALDLQTQTGWHVTEVQRFAIAGEIEPPTPAQKQQGVAGILMVGHKSGEQHRTAVGADTLAAAQRLRERNGFAISWYHRAVKSACKAAGIKPFGPGVMRHSVATWAIKEGADVATVSTFLGHRSAQTTKKLYATHATPRNPLLLVPTPVTLKRRPARTKPSATSRK